MNRNFLGWLVIVGLGTSCWGNLCPPQTPLQPGVFEGNPQNYIDDELGLSGDLLFVLLDGVLVVQYTDKDENVWDIVYERD